MEAEKLNDNHRCMNTCIVALLLGVLLLACYVNSLGVSWQYDDYGNIVHNTKIHMTDWSWTQLKQSFSAGLPFQIVSRPLAYLTFALNHKLGGLNVFGYHLFNLIVHWTASFFLFLFIRDTLRLPVLKGRYDGHAIPIAAIAAALWATHPIQVTAVTYIVQRMASMAGMFYILVMFCYLRYRTTHRFGYGVAVILCGVCAFLTKENTVMVVYALLLFDFVLLRGTSSKPTKIVLWGIGFTLLLAGAGLLYTDFDLLQLVDSYEIRPFTPVERLMTQPRVILLYLGLIAVPMTSKMTLLHDIEISHSLWSPWTTFPAIAGVMLSVVTLAMIARKYPLLAFCGLFFFLNHLIEGSFLNLEMIYEHRNYIPSMLLFVAPAVAAVKSIDFFHYRRSFQWMIAAGALLVLVSNGYTTYRYNLIFKTELSLWDHAVRRAPLLSLAHSNLGSAYWEVGDSESALSEFSKAQVLNRYNNAFHRGVVLFNLGLYTFQYEEDYRSAAAFFTDAIMIYPQNSRIWYHLGLTQIALEEGASASATVSAAIAKWPTNPDFHYLAAVVYLKKGDDSTAIEAAEKALELNSEHGGALMVKAQAFHNMGESALSIKTWKHFMTNEPRDLHGIIALIELLATTEKYEEAKGYLDKFGRLRGKLTLDEVLDKAVKTSAYGAYPVDKATIKAIFAQLGSMKN